MKKPSERIKEIREEGGKEINLDGPGMYYTLSKSEAIVQYLDEEYERNKPCKEECECVKCDCFCKCCPCEHTVIINY